MIWVYMFLINFTKGGRIKCNIFLVSEGNKINFTHYSRLYGQAAGRRLKRNTAPLLHKRAKRITPIFHKNG